MGPWPGRQDAFDGAQGLSRLCSMIVERVFKGCSRGVL